ncbi:MAG: Holliday junction resolvase RuvX, partial [Acidobacteriales bacterium]|nr:Holliday junction resolvase RuvX [Terriglobales bacterium]
RIASPLETYTRQGVDQDGQHLRKVLEDEAIVRVVIGLPMHLDGHEGEQAALARKFGKWLAELTGVDIVFWDERFTTSEAEDSLREAGLSQAKRKARRDRVAATLILQSYLDANQESGIRSQESGI